MMVIFEYCSTTTRKLIKVSDNGIVLISMIFKGVHCVLHSFVFVTFMVNYFKVFSSLSHFHFLLSQKAKYYTITDNET